KSTLLQPARLSTSQWRRSTVGTAIHTTLETSSFVRSCRAIVHAHHRTGTWGLARSRPSALGASLEQTPGLAILILEPSASGESSRELSRHLMPSGRAAWNLALCRRQNPGSSGPAKFLERCARYCSRIPVDCLTLRFSR